MGMKAGWHPLDLDLTSPSFPVRSSPAPWAHGVSLNLHIFSGVAGLGGGGRG